MDRNIEAQRPNFLEDETWVYTQKAGPSSCTLKQYALLTPRSVSLSLQEQSWALQKELRASQDTGLYEMETVCSHKKGQSNELKRKRENRFIVWIPIPGSI